MSPKGVKRWGKLSANQPAPAEVSGSNAGWAGWVPSQVQSCVQGAQRASHGLLGRLGLVYMSNYPISGEGGYDGTLWDRSHGTEILEGRG